MVSLTALAVTIRNSGKFATTLVEYWQCEATGVDPGKQCDRLYALFEELGPPALIGISNLLYLILPLVNLIFVINVTELLKAKIQDMAWPNFKISAYYLNYPQTQR